MDEAISRDVIPTPEVDMQMWHGESDLGTHLFRTLQTVVLLARYAKRGDGFPKAVIDTRTRRTHLGVVFCRQSLRVIHDSTASRALFRDHGVSDDDWDRLGRVVNRGKS